MKLEWHQTASFQNWNLSYCLLISGVSQQRFGVGVISQSAAGENKAFCFGLTSSRKAAVDFLEAAARNNVLPSNFGEVAEDWFS